MPDVQPMPEPAELAIELERPSGEDRDEAADHHRVGGRDIVGGVVREPGRNRKPQAEREARPVLPPPHFRCTCKHGFLHVAPRGAYGWTPRYDGAFGHGL